MTIRQLRCALIFLVLTATIFSASRQPSAGGTEKHSTLLASSPRLLVKSAIHVDLSAPLKDSTPAVSEADSTSKPQADLAQRPTPTPTPTMTPVTAASAAVEQLVQGQRPAARVVESFDGLGFGFEGPQGVANLRNPSDNTLAVGPDHVVQIVNTRMAVFSKKGKRFPTTGKILFGPVVTRAVFAGFGGQCEARNNGDAVVRYDQLANRWLIVMPIFARGPVRPDQPPAGISGDPAAISPPGKPNQPGPAVQLTPPTQANPADPNRAGAATQG